MLGRERGARQIVWLQRSQIEEKNNHAAIANLLPHFFRRSHRTDGYRYRGSLRRVRLFELLHVVIIERGNFLVLAVFRDTELILPQIFQETAIPIGDRDIHLHQVDGRSDGSFLIGGHLRRRGRRNGLLRILRRSCRRQQRGDGEKCDQTANF